MRTRIADVRFLRSSTPENTSESAEAVDVVANFIAPVMDGTPAWTDAKDVEHRLAFMDEPDEIVVSP